MRLTINETTINVTECYAYRYGNGKLVLKFITDRTEIGHDALYDLIKNNTSDIILTKDNGSTETFTGFRYTLTILTKETTYEVEVECVSETERKVGDLQNEVSIQNATIDELREIIAEQAELIASQSEMVDTIIAEILPMLGDEGEIE